MVQFKRFVEPGRLCVVNYGPHHEKTCVIVEIIDHRRVVVDGPTTKVARQQMPIRWLTLTPLVAKFQKGARTGIVKKALADGEIIEKFYASSWGKKLKNREARKNMTDFERFKAMTLQSRKGQMVRKEINKLKKK